MNEARLLPNREEDRFDDRAAELAIGCFAALCRDRLADHLLSFSAAHPHVSVGIHELALAELLPAVGARRVTLAIAPERAPALAGVGAVAAMTLWREQALLAMAVDHRLASRVRLTPVDLLDTVMLLPTGRAESELQRYLIARLFPDARPPANARPQHGDDLLARAAAGEGVVLVLAGHPLPPGAVARPIADAAAGFAVQAWWRADHHCPPLTALLRLLGGPRD